MGLSTRTRRLLLVLTLLATPLVVGSKCIFIASSGDDDKDRDNHQQPVKPTAAGALIPATKGVAYASGAVTGVTGDHGEFRYQDGEPVSFSIGDIALGTPVQGKAVITVADLAGDTADATVIALNIERLLHSLDADPGDATLTIPDSVRAGAVRDNAAVASALVFLDFADAAAFNNAASQIIAALTGDYPYTATLVDGAILRPTDMRSPAF